MDPYETQSAQLNGGTLDNATLSVTSDVVKEDDHLQQATQPEGPSEGLDQSDKPRAASKHIGIPS